MDGVALFSYFLDNGLHLATKLPDGFIRQSLKNKKDRPSVQIPSKHIRLLTKWTPATSLDGFSFPLFVFLVENYKSATIYHSPTIPLK